MNDTYSHLLRAVLDEPDEDLHRSAFADWLEEHGDAGQREWAEFIRVQCELARLGSWVDYYRAEGVDRLDCTGERLRRREAELFDLSHTPGGFPRLGPLAHLAEVFHPREWRRGFLYAVTCRLSDWLEHGPRLVAHQPVRVATLKPDEPYFTLRSVPNYDRTSTRDLIALLRDQAVCRLHTLDLSGLIIEPGEWGHQALPNAFRPWRGLKRLVLPWHGFPPGTPPVTSGDQRRQWATLATRQALPGVEVVGPPPPPTPPES